MKNSNILLGVICAFIVTTAAYAGTVADGDIVTFTANSTAKAAEVNQNFTAIKNAVNGSANDISMLQASFSGNGSAGNLTISAHTNWDTTPPTNPYFNNITIESSQTLSVPAGTTIRCAGMFTNNGTLLVYTGAEAKGAFALLGGTVGASMGLTSVAHPGDTSRAASLGNYQGDGTTNPLILEGGKGGKGIPKAVAITAFGGFKIGGGSGAGYDSQGNQGGGLVKIYCNSAITNNGSILAQGSAATNSSIGGGGGGIVILASRTAVNNTSGTINVSGGNASVSDYSFGGNGGGGGGGIIIMASPTAPVLGATVITGGSGASGVVVVSTGGRTAGAGGGGSGGAGGYGGYVSSGGAKSVGTNGSPGYTISLTLDPIFIAR